MSSFTGASVTTVTSLVSDRGCRELLGEGKDMVTPADDAAADGDGVIDVTVVKAGDITLSSGDNSAERVTLAFDTRLLSPKALEQGGVGVSPSHPGEWSIPLTSLRAFVLVVVVVVVVVMSRGSAGCCETLVRTGSVVSDVVLDVADAAIVGSVDGVDGVDNVLT
ncbi:hypothetical protein C0Q70_19688 [Pomacea canaliculata]|uniref:Uncharacterized protein n=1 Tax=Pomacea canaliculata TaxID=400727 RepID=A0A2T7NDF9_POMCA|nr:hypothetical protein C0Q70_19688 [Pomacea canaliculata]